MRIPDSFKAAQKAAFQDKEVTHRPAVRTTGALGSVTTKPGPASATYRVNLQVISDAQVAQDWGLAVARDAILTSSEPLPFSLGDYVQHGASLYQVVGMPEHDSHVKLLLKYQPGVA